MIKSDFFDVDVGVIQTVEILPDRKVNGGRGWTLKEVLCYISFSQLLT